LASTLPPELNDKIKKAKEEVHLRGQGLKTELVTNASKKFSASKEELKQSLRTEVALKK
jgi:hypothetical protein